MKHGGDIYSHPIEYDFSVNLNPLDLTAIARKIMEKSEKQLCFYPDPMQRRFREAVAVLEGVSLAEVYGGNGASEILMAVVRMLNPSRALLLCPSFAGYRHALSVVPECQIVQYMISEDKDFVVNESFIDFLKHEANMGLDLLLLTNPNNPTGKIISEDILKKIFEICQANNIKLVIDECFIRMTKAAYSMAQYINKYDGLFVVNAFTKLFSIPGVRVGYVLSDEANIKELSRFLPEWNMSSIAENAGIICCEYLEEPGFEANMLEVIEKERDYLTKGLKELGFKVYDSNTVFILLYSEENLYEYLLSKKILIRDCADFEGLRKGFYRIAVKNHQDNEILIKTLKMRNK